MQTVPYPRADRFCKATWWPRTLASSTLAGQTGENPQSLLGPPNGLAHTIWPQGSVSLADFAPVPGLDIAELLTPQNITHGDVVSPQAIAASHVIAFERNGNSPASGGGWESCNWTFDDTVSTVSVRWDGRAGAARDPHVLANGSIRGADYTAHFGINSTDPQAAIGDDEVISYLLFDLSDLQVVNDPVINVTLAGIPSPGPGEEITPDVDAVAFLERW